MIIKIFYKLFVNLFIFSIMYVIFIFGAWSFSHKYFNEKCSEYFGTTFHVVSLGAVFKYSILLINKYLEKILRIKEKSDMCE